MPTLSYPLWIDYQQAADYIKCRSNEVINVLGTPAHILFYVDDIVLVFESHACL